jgi:hypothetical protein
MTLGHGISAGWERQDGDGRWPTDRADARRPERHGKGGTLSFVSRQLNDFHIDEEL